MMPALKTILLCLGTIGLSACSAKAELQTSQAILVEGYRTSGTTISFVAESNGCSKNDDFSLKIEQNSSTEALLTIVRNKVDHCKRMPFPKTFTLTLDEELKGKKLSITNPKSKSPAK